MRVRELAERFDDFLVDLWGVVHDGEKPYAGAVDALARLRAIGDKRVMFVTNTSRASDAVIANLVDTMKIDRALFVGVVSSGDVTRDAVAELPRTMRCYHYGDSSFVPWLFDLGFAMVDDVADAELVVASGAPRDEEGLASVRALLEPAARRGVRLVCTNPDEIIPHAKGPTLGPGVVARAYAELGGDVILYGKPHAPIYAAARKKLGGDASRRLVAIGDLPETDIRGARAAGIPSVLITRGRTVDASHDPPDYVLEWLAW